MKEGRLYIRWNEISPVKSISSHSAHRNHIILVVPYKIIEIPFNYIEICWSPKGSKRMVTRTKSCACTDLHANEVSHLNQVEVRKKGNKSNLRLGCPF